MRDDLVDALAVLAKVIADCDGRDSKPPSFGNHTLHSNTHNRQCRPNRAKSGPRVCENRKSSEQDICTVTHHRRKDTDDMLLTDLLGMWLCLGREV